MQADLCSQLQPQTLSKCRCSSKRNSSRQEAGIVPAGRKAIQAISVRLAAIKSPLQPVHGTAPADRKAIRATSVNPVAVRNRLLNGPVPAAALTQENSARTAVSQGNNFL